VTALEYIIPANYTLGILPNMSTELLTILVAVVIILILNWVAYMGIDSSAKVLMFFAVVTILTIIAVLIPGLFTIDVTNFEPFFFEGTAFQNSLLIFAGLFIIMETYFGWESATFLAEETKNAEEVIPKSLVITSILVAILGVLLSIVALGNIPWQVLSLSATPFHDISTVFYSENIWTALNLGVFITMIGSAAGGIVSTPRLLLAHLISYLFYKSN